VASVMWKLILVAIGVSAGACDSDDTRSRSQAGTRERELRDSVIGQSKLPGAAAVERARDAQAISRERAATLDSMQRALDSMQQ
jgi:hypothetical protein